MACTKEMPREIGDLEQSCLSYNVERETGGSQAEFLPRLLLGEGGKHAVCNLHTGPARVLQLFLATMHVLHAMRTFLAVRERELRGMARKQL